MHRSPLALRRPPAVASDAVLASQPLLVAARGTLPPPRIRGIMPQATSVPQRADWCSGPGLSAVSECFPSILLFGPADDGDIRLWSGKYPAAREVTSFLHGCVNRTGCTLGGRVSTLPTEDSSPGLSSAERQTSSSIKDTHGPTYVQRTTTRT